MENLQIFQMYRFHILVSFPICTHFKIFYHSKVRLKIKSKVLLHFCSKHVFSMLDIAVTGEKKRASPKGLNCYETVHKLR